MAIKKKAAAAKLPEAPLELVVKALETETIVLWVVGTSPLFENAMSLKAKQQLLFPGTGRKTAADRAQSLKHEPEKEFIASMYKRRDNNGPTRVMLPATAFKGALMNVAIETAGAKKTQIGRLVWVNGNYVDVYGLPQLNMSVVRTAGIEHTPDIRTRAILPEWCCQLSITYVKPTLTQKTLVTLLHNAGLIIGVGDFRQEKGKGNFGQFKIAADHSEVVDIIKNGGLEAQDAAISEMKTYDGETDELFNWYKDERVRRGV